MELSVPKRLSSILAIGLSSVCLTKANGDDPVSPGCLACQAEARLHAISSSADLTRLLNVPVSPLGLGSESGIRFAVDTPSIQPGSHLFPVIAMCGHTCDGERCYVDDATDATMSTASSGDDSDIVSSNAAPPMPMLQLTNKPSKSVATDDQRDWSATLDNPVAVPPAPSASDVVFSSRADESEHFRELLELERKHHREILDMMEQNTELRVENSQLRTECETMETLMNLMLENAKLEGDLAAAKEWISDRIAADLSKEHSTHHAQSTQDNHSRPVPFARSTYVPLFDNAATSSESCAHCFNSSTAGSSVTDPPVHVERTAQTAESTDTK